MLLEDWNTQRITNRLPIPALESFRYATTPDGTILAVIVSDSRTRPYGEKFGSTHLVVWDIATGWERLRVDQEMHSFFGAFTHVAVARGGRLVATASQHDRIDIWNGFNGYLLDSFDIGNDITALAFSDEGGVLATGHADGSVYIWNTRLAWDQAVLPRRFNAKIADRYWVDLAGDGRKPALALQYLLGDPAQALEMLKRNLRPAAAAKGIAGALEELGVPLPNSDDDSSDSSQPVSPVIRALQHALRQSPTEDAAARIKLLLDEAALPMSPEMRRPIIGVLLAEQLNTEESRHFLQQMAGGATSGLETQVAKAAMQRIKLKQAMVSDKVTR